jgi:predicted dehydrogenase
VTQISAREFAGNSRRAKFKSLFDLVWICTKPELQISILESLNHSHVETERVILEKPFAVNADQLSRLVSIVQEAPYESFASAPWSYSEQWKSSKEFFDQSGIHRNISITRGGDHLRDYVTPEQDWLIHDLMLLQDLEKENAQNLQVAKCRCYSIYGSGHLIGMLSDASKWHLQGGYISHSRIAVWRVETEELILTVNFQNGSRIVERRDGKILQNTTFDNSRVLNSMASDIICDRIGSGDVVSTLKLSRYLFQPKEYGDAQIRYLT